MAWSKNTKVDVKSYDREYRARNLERRRVQQQAYEQRLHQRARDILGNKCVDCGNTEELQLDHINDDGKEDRKQANSRNAILAILKRNCEGIQLLCYPCHVKKTWNK